MAATLELTAPQHGPSDAKVVLVGSSTPAEGRTTLALSLAAFVAFTGRRALLIDADFRKGAVLGKLDKEAERKIINRRRQKARASVGDIRPIPDLGIDYIPLSRADFHSPALFSNEPRPQLLRKIRESYDCVIVDGPPLLGIAEARLLASMVDKVLFVVKWGSTRPEMARNALNLLQSVNCYDQALNGAPTCVVTQVNLKKHARYRFGDVAESFVRYRKHYVRSN
jgi:Mrp family chromosome partitioning ATPase